MAFPNSNPGHPWHGKSHGSRYVPVRTGGRGTAWHPAAARRTVFLILDGCQHSRTALALADSSPPSRLPAPRRNSFLTGGRRRSSGGQAARGSEGERGAGRPLACMPLVRSLAASLGRVDDAASQSPRCQQAQQHSSSEAALPAPGSMRSSFGSMSGGTAQLCSAH